MQVGHADHLDRLHPRPSGVCTAQIEIACIDRLRIQRQIDQQDTGGRTKSASTSGRRELTKSSEAPNSTTASR